MNLQNLGLSEYEEKAFRALVKLGKSSASRISREGEISYGKIYEVLASLERKGLVKIVPEKTKMFIPTDPQNLLNLIKIKEGELDKLKKEVNELKQIYESSEEEIIEIAEGKRNFYKILKQLKEPKKFKYTVKFTSEHQPEWERKDKKFIKRGIDVKSLVKYDKETEKNVKKWLKINKNIKQIKNSGVAMDLRDSEIFISLIKKNKALLIKDSNLSEIMGQLFLAAYEKAKNIE